MPYLKYSTAAMRSRAIKMHLRRMGIRFLGSGWYFSGLRRVVGGGTESFDSCFGSGVDMFFMSYKGYTVNSNWKGDVLGRYY